MISREIFNNCLISLSEQKELDDKLSEALTPFCDSTVYFGVNNYTKDALLDLLKDVCNDEFDFIRWWLYEGGKDKLVIDYDGTHHVLETSDDLYNYIFEHQAEWFVKKLLRQSKCDKLQSEIDKILDSFKEGE